MRTDMTRRPILFLLLAAALGGANLAHGGGQPASSAEEVTPLLIGASVPKLVLRDIQGKPFDLDEAIGERPTILILYRGGW